MKLFHARPSPYVRKVMVLLEEAGEADAVELIDGVGAPTAPNEKVVAANPIGKIPCLIDGDLTLYDSRVICRYLNDTLNAGLYPDAPRLWRALTLEAHADGMLDAALLCVYEVRCRDEALRSEAWVDAQRAKIARGLDALEADWMDHLNGPLDIGVVATGCALGYLDFRREMGGWPDWREDRPNLTRWAETLFARPSMRATAPG